MSEQNKPDEKSSLATPGIAIVAILLSLFAAQESILKSNRPPTIDSERTVSEDVRSRLWQDPFQAVEEHRKQHRQTQNASINLTTPDEISFHYSLDGHGKITFKNARNDGDGKNSLILFPELSDQFGYEYNHGPTRVCYDQGDMGDRKKAYKDSKILAHSIEELRCKIKIDRKSFNEKLHVLAVMVPGGPYAEDKERRLRARYAVISALTDLAYTPQDPEHVEFVEFKETCDAVLRELRAAQLAENKDKEELNKLKEKVHFCHMGAFMPYEWFKHQKNNDANKILVLWLDNSGFTASKAPLNTIAFLKKELGIKEPSSHLSIIGPAGSDSLKEMYREISKLSFDISSTDDANANDTGNFSVSLYKNLEDSYIYTATATVKEERLDKDFGSRNQKNREWLNTRIIRTISTQDKLANTILCELALRGVIPYHAGSTQAIERKCNGLSGFMLADNHKPHHIALIGERDTFYSQELTESLLDAIRPSSDNNNSQSDWAHSFRSSLNSNRNPPWVHSFPYLRGLDGITSEYSPVQKDNKNKESQANNPNNQETKDTVERPVGSSQLDYLRSLAEQIKRLDNLHADEGGIKAIGITGSDTYDKLLILQALRKKFPKTLFFTTDLDARLFYPAEIKWTRNLLVASPFGLQLNDEVPVESNIVQKKGAPFRDVYQTSIYLTILLAMQCHGEIGLCGKSAQDKANEWTAEPRMFEIGNYGAIDLSHSSNRTNSIHPEPENAKNNNPMFALLLIIGIFPLTILLQLVLPRRYHFGIWVIAALFLILIVFYCFVLFNRDLGSEPLSFSSGISSWPATMIRISTIILVIIFIRVIRDQIKKGDDSIKDYLPSVCNSEAVQAGKSENLSLWLGNTDYFYKYLWIDNWRKAKSNESVKFSELWCEYSTYRKLPNVALRISILFLIYFLCILFFGFWEDFFNPSIPFRGKCNFYFSAGVVFFAIFAFFTLIFAIVDISHITSHFVSLLKEGNINLDNKLIDKYRKRFNLPEAAVKDKILMDIIYKTTKTINGFIYYPFIFLFLFILARNSYFDNWQFTTSLFIIIGFIVFIAWCSTFRLTKAAKIARKEILKRLNSLIQNNNSKNSNEIKSLITEIENLNKGPFLPLTQHPMVLSWLIPFGSAGGGYLLNYFAFSAS